MRTWCAAVLLLVATGATAQNVCTAAPDGSGWECGTADNPPPVREVEAVPDPQPVHTPQVQPARPIGRPAVRTLPAPQPTPRDAAPTQGIGPLTLQLASVTSMEDYYAFVDNFDLDTATLLAVRDDDGSVRYLVLMGEYPDLPTVQAVAQDLPPHVKALRPVAVPLLRLRELAQGIEQPVLAGQAPPEAVARTPEPPETPAASAYSEPTPPAAAEEPAVELVAVDPIVDEASLPVEPPVEQAEPVASVTPAPEPEVEPLIAPASREDIASGPQSLNAASEGARAGSAVTHRPDPEPPSRQVAKTSPPRPAFADLAGDYTIQVGAVPRGGAERDAVERLGLSTREDVYVLTDPSGRRVIVVGRFDSLREAERAARRLPATVRTPWVRRAAPLVSR